MTERQIELVKTSWKTISGVSQELLGDVFYSKLFLHHPQLRHMFPKSMEEQYKKLMDMLSVIVVRLERLEELKEDIAHMARRHAGYGVKPAHYKMVGDALLWTLQQGLGRDWNEDVKDAWEVYYRELSNTMINAAGYTSQELMKS
jgi:hemoglobin-like flavoprotein